MGILSLFKKKQETQPEVQPQERKEVSNIEEWFKLTLGNKLKFAQEEALRLSSKLTDDFSDLRKSASILENANFEKGDKTYSAANMIKDSYAKKIFGVLNATLPLRQTDYASLKEFHQNSFNAVNNIKKISPRQMFLLSTYFKHASSKIVSDLTNIEKRLKMISDFIKSEGKLIKLNEEISKKSRDYSSYLKQIKSLSIREDKILKEIELSERNKYKNISKINEIKKSKDFQKMLSIIDDIEKLKNRTAEIEKNANNQIFAIKRPLKKLEYETKEGCLSWLNNPFKDVIMEGRGHIIKNAAEDVINLSMSGKIILKHREKEKLKSLLEDLDSMNSLKSEFEDKTRKIEENQKFIKENLRSIIQDKEESENLLSKYAEQTKNLETQRRAIFEERENIKMEMENQKKEIEKLIFENSGKLVNINYKI